MKYFNHDSNAHSGKRLKKLLRVFGAEGYGLFWLLVESAAEDVSNCGGWMHPEFDLEGLVLDAGFKSLDEAEPILAMMERLRDTDGLGLIVRDGAGRVGVPALLDHLSERLAQRMKTGRADWTPFKPTTKPMSPQSGQLSPQEPPVLQHSSAYKEREEREEKNTPRMRERASDSGSQNPGAERDRNPNPAQPPAQAPIAQQRAAGDVGGQEFETLAAHAFYVANDSKLYTAHSVQQATERAIETWRAIRGSSPISPAVQRSLMCVVLPDFVLERFEELASAVAANSWARQHLPFAKAVKPKNARAILNGEYPPDDEPNAPKDGLTPAERKDNQAAQLKHRDAFLAICNHWDTKHMLGQVSLVECKTGKDADLARLETDPKWLEHWYIERQIWSGKMERNESQ